MYKIGFAQIFNQKTLYENVYKSSQTKIRINQVNCKSFSKISFSVNNFVCF